MNALQAELKLAAPAPDAIGWRFAPGTGMTAASIVLFAAGRPIAQAHLEPRDHERFRGWAAAIMPKPGHAPTVVTLTLYTGFIGGLTMEHVPQAKTVRQFCDQFGRMHIELIDADGVTLGRATMGADEYARFLGDGCDMLSLAKEGGLALQPHAGTA